MKRTDIKVGEQYVVYRQGAYSQGRARGDAERALRILAGAVPDPDAS